MGLGWWGDISFSLKNISSLFFTFTECNATTNSTPAPNTADETFSITTSTALFTLRDDLDYETTKTYYFLMTVVDQGQSPQLTGSIALRVKQVNNKNFKIWDTKIITYTFLK